MFSIIATFAQATEPIARTQNGVDNAIGIAMGFIIAMGGWQGLQKLISKVAHMNGNGKRPNEDLINAIEQNTKDVCESIDDMGTQIKDGFSLEKERLDNAVIRILDRIRFHSGRGDD